jgi:hypothetical protein
MSGFKFGNKIGSVPNILGSKVNSNAVTFGSKHNKIHTQDIKFDDVDTSNNQKVSDLERHHNSLSETHRKQG